MAPVGIHLQEMAGAFKGIVLPFVGIAAVTGYGAFLAHKPGCRTSGKVLEGQTGDDLVAVATPGGQGRSCAEASDEQEAHGTSMFGAARAGGAVSIDPNYRERGVAWAG